jgi:hypothetical protein
MARRGVALTTRRRWHTGVAACNRKRARAAENAAPRERMPARRRIRLRRQASAATVTAMSPKPKDVQQGEQDEQAQYADIEPDARCYVRPSSWPRRHRPGVEAERQGQSHSLLPRETLPCFHRTTGVTDKKRRGSSAPSSSTCRHGPDRSTCDVKAGRKTKLRQGQLAAAPAALGPRTGCPWGCWGPAPALLAEPCRSEPDGRRRADASRAPGH